METVMSRFKFHNLTNIWFDKAKNQRWDPLSPWVDELRRLVAEK